MNKPNFFIVGAPRCGTTALSEYLRTHPNLFFSQPKEPHYFAEEFPRHRLVQTRDEYLGLFRRADSRHKAIGEGSVFYLYSSSALEKIKEFDPHAKIIVMLRNPVDLVYSIYMEMLYIKIEDQDFKTAWELQNERRQGRELPPQCHTPAFLDYLGIGSLGSQVERLFRIFPKEQIRMIFFEEFTQSTRTVYEETLAFLGLASDGRTEFPRINQPKAHKWNWLARLTQHPPEPLRRLAAITKNALGMQSVGFLDGIRNSNSAIMQRPPLTEELKNEMREAFKPEIEKLEQLTGRDLSIWLSKGK